MTKIQGCAHGLLALFGSVALFACTPASVPAKADGDEKVLRVAPVSDLENLDPMSSSSYIIRDHGYMIYDTLFGMDANGKIQPPIVDTYVRSGDKKTWTFTLREGLEFHDGKQVTSDDVIASIKRWEQKDTMGQTLMSVASWEAVNAKTFRLTLSTPYGLVLESLGHPDSYVPFIMPKRVADTPVSTSIDDTTGSGPFIYKKDESRKGEKVVYIRNTKYKPRVEPASGTAGGKVAKVDRVEWIIIKGPANSDQRVGLGRNRRDRIPG
jgi:peptide/nickel transport system substrate-binding protein